MKTERRKIILGIQSGYYLLIGLWPLLHIDSFMEITGYKTDLWLVKTVGLLLVCTAITFIIDLFYRENSNSVVFLSISSAVGLLSVDIYYSITDEIRDIYLIDAALQLLLIESWMIFRKRRLVNKLNNPKETGLVDS